MFYKDLFKQKWTLSGWVPYQWKLGRSMEVKERLSAETRPIEVTLPISVQKALLDNKLIEDWNVGLNFRKCEWIENRHWLYETDIEVPADGEYEIAAGMLDHCGWYLLDGKTLGYFSGSMHKHVLQLGHLSAGTHHIGFVFDFPPRWLGQYGYTSQMQVGKVRFNYTWDWVIRLVQCGIGDSLILRSCRTPELSVHHCQTTLNSLTLRIDGKNLPEKTQLAIQLLDEAEPVAQCSAVPGQEITLSDLSVEPWQLNGHGQAKLYTVKVTAGDVAEKSFRVGFRSFRRLPNPGAPEHALPWLFEVNGEPIFLQGFNWTPILPNTIDVPDEDYRTLIKMYKDLNVNILRVWGGARRERDIFYDLCDEAGIMVWQEFPLSSSGCDNIPPDDEESMREMALIAEDYMEHLNTHVSLFLWSGGNELFYNDKPGCRPCDGSEPILQLMKKFVKERTPDKPMVPTSPSGDSAYVLDECYGQGVHHDVHGPWKSYFDDLEDWWKTHWDNADGLLFSEFGAPGASSVKLLKQYQGELNPEPFSDVNPYWTRPVKWHTEFSGLKFEHGRLPETVEEFVEWSQQRQYRSLELALTPLKRKFPACGGAILWMGHDCYPLPTNCSLIDFDRNLKPAAEVVKKVFTSAPEDL